jgi:hypothetical protein
MAFFTGAKKFQVKEIEMFEIKDETVLPPNPVSFQGSKS